MNDWLFDFSAVRTPDFELEVAVGAMADARDIEDPVERRVGRALLLNWATEGAGFAQNVADVENMSPQERHDLLQRAHRALGLETPDDRREREEREERDRIVWHRPIPECVICGEVARGAGGFPDANTPPRVSGTAPTTCTWPSPATWTRPRCRSARTCSTSPTTPRSSARNVAMNAFNASSESATNSGDSEG